MQFGSSRSIETICLAAAVSTAGGGVGGQRDRITSSKYDDELN
jgi:hypothetical protein